MDGPSGRDVAFGVSVGESVLAGVDVPDGVELAVTGSTILELLPLGEGASGLSSPQAANSRVKDNDPQRTKFLTVIFNSCE